MKTSSIVELDSATTDLQNFIKFFKSAQNKNILLYSLNTSGKIIEAGYREHEGKRLFLQDFNILDNKKA